MLQPSVSSQQASAPKFSGSIANAPSMLYNSLPSTSTTIYTVGGLGLVFGAYKLLRGYFFPAEQPTSAKTQHKREIRKKDSPVKPSPNSQHSKTTETGLKRQSISELLTQVPQVSASDLPAGIQDIKNFSNLKHLIDNRVPLGKIDILLPNPKLQFDRPSLTFHFIDPITDAPYQLKLFVNLDASDVKRMQEEGVGKTGLVNIGEHLKLTNFPPGVPVNLIRNKPASVTRQWRPPNVTTNDGSQSPRKAPSGTHTPPLAQQSIDELLRIRPLDESEELPHGADQKSYSDLRYLINDSKRQISRIDVNPNTKRFESSFITFYFKDSGQRKDYQILLKLKNSYRIRPGLDTENWNELWRYLKLDVPQTLEVISLKPVKHIGPTPEFLRSAKKSRAK